MVLLSMKILLTLLLLFIITKTFLLGNYIIHVNVNQNYNIVKDVENSTVGIKVLLSISNYTIMSYNISINKYNSSEIIIPYYLVYNNLSFSIIYLNYTANVTIRSLVIAQNNTYINGILSLNNTQLSSPQNSFNSISISNNEIIVIGAMISAGVLYAILRIKFKKV